MSREHETPPGAARTSDSAAGRLVGVFVSPVRTFESIAGRPTWALPLLLWIALSLGVTAVLMPRMDWGAMFRARMEKSGQSIRDAQIDKQVERFKSFAWLYYVLSAITPVAVAIIPAGLFWLGLKAFGWDIAFRQSFAVTTHAILPGILASVLLIPVLWRLDAVDPKSIGDLLKSNPGFLVDANRSAALHSLFQSLDVFSFWTMALLVVGLSAAAKITRGKAAALVLTLWALYVLGKTGFTAILS